jgi:NADH-quinone oxidoreductase subunit L
VPSEIAWADVVVGLAPAWPALGALVIAAWLARGVSPRERTVVRISTAALWLTFLSVAFAGARALATPGHVVDVRLGHWYHAADHGYELVFLVDGISAPVAIVASILLLATCRFSANYLHGEPGFVRFFALMLVFAAGLQLLLLGGGIEILFAGWETVGMASVLLVAFFHERSGPVRAAIRVLATYRLCDVGLVLAGVFLHQARHTSVFVNTFAASDDPASKQLVAAAVIGLLVAAMGKSAQFPVGGWLPRAMEGPTASSAVFYGSLSVHAGVYLLARAEPLYASSPVLRWIIIGVGLVTAGIATLSGQVSADAKSALAYSTIAQVGIMFAECGFGFPHVAIVHLTAHALLRYYQFLRTPAILQDALKRRAALGSTVADETAARWEIVGVGWRRFLYRLAIERFEGEAMLERWIASPALRASALLDRVEHAAMGDAKDQSDAFDVGADRVSTIPNEPVRLEEWAPAEGGKH